MRDATSASERARRAAAFALPEPGLLGTGDIKPSNVMWFATGEHMGRWKLIDVDGLLPVGASRDMSAAQFYTAIYCAPELAQHVAAGSVCRYVGNTRPVGPAQTPAC